MSNKPSHYAYVVTPAKDGSEGRGHWTRVGAVFTHGNGKGFDIVIPPGISLSGRIVCTEPRDGETRGTEGGAQ